MRERRPHVPLVHDRQDAVTVGPVGAHDADDDVARVLLLGSRDLGDGFPFVGLQLRVQHLRHHDPRGAARSQVLVLPLRGFLRHVGLGALAGRRIGQAPEQRLAPSLAHPRRQAGVEAVGGAVPGVAVRGHVEARGARVLEPLQDLGHPAEVRPVGGLQVPDVGADLGLARDAEDLVERGVDAAGLRALVREVGAAVARGHLRQRDQLLGRGVDVGDVLQRGRNAERALAHRGIDQRLHARKLRRGGGPVLAADHDRAHASGADERREVDSGAAALQAREVLVEGAPVRAHAVALVEVCVFGLEPLVERRDRLPFAGDLGRDPLGDFRGGSRVDQHVELGLTEQVDEAGRNDEAGRVDGARGARAAQGADRGDLAAANAHVGREPGRSRAVDDATPFDQEVERGRAPQLRETCKSQASGNEEQGDSIHDRSAQASWRKKLRARKQ